jgi:hypothetical protein
LATDSKNTNGVTSQKTSFFKNKNVKENRGVSGFKKVSPSRSKLVKDEIDDLPADSHNILNWWKNHFSQLLNAQSVSDVRQTETHTAEPLVPGPSYLEVEIAIAKLKSIKYTGSDQIPTEFIRGDGDILVSAIHELIDFIWNKKELSDQWKESIIVPVHKTGDKTD